MKKIFLPLLLSVFLVSTSCKDTNGPSEPSTITISNTTLSLQTSETHTLVATVTPATTDAMVWTSSDESVATVFHGVVSPQREGTTTITVTSGSLQATCVVTIANKAFSLVWSDDFDGTSLDLTKWNVEQTGSGGGNQELQYYTDRATNLRVAGGYLTIEAKKEVYQTRNYTSARINTKDKASFAYGKIEARISLPAGAGTWPAFWMLGYGSWPVAGEIDIMEHVGSQPTMISHAVHTRQKNGTYGNNWYSRNYHTGLEGSFHTYGIEWEKKYDQGDDCLRFYVDGELTATLWEPHNIDDVEQWPFNKEFYIILNLAIGGTMGGAVDDAIFNNTVQMQVDWVRVYQRI